MLKETGERQVKDKLVAVDLDHQMRYMFAASLIPAGARVADIGCGIGYGSYYIACVTDCHSVKGIDIAEEAISYAKEFYSHPKIDFIVNDIIASEDEDSNKFDVITAFEVVEHIENSLDFLKKIAELLSENGIAIFTTPNQQVIPFDADMFRFHFRHYTQEEVCSLVENAGMEIIHHFSQNGTVVYGFPGNAFHVLVCRRKNTNAFAELGSALPFTAMHQGMASYERTDWLVQHIPQKSSGELLKKMKMDIPFDENIRKELINHKDAYMRKYFPQSYADNPDFTGTLGELSIGDVIEQKFVCNKSGLCGLSLLPALFFTEYEGIIVVSLYDNNKLHALRTFSDIKDNEKILFDFSPIEKSEGKEFGIVIYIAWLARHAKISFYKTEHRERCTLYLNGKAMNDTLTYWTLFY